MRYSRFMSFFIFPDVSRLFSSPVLGAPKAPKARHRGGLLDESQHREVAEDRGAAREEQRGDHWRLGQTLKQSMAGWWQVMI